MWAVKHSVKHCEQWSTAAAALMWAPRLERASKQRLISLPPSPPLGHHHCLSPAPPASSPTASSPSPPASQRQANFGLLNRIYIFAHKSSLFSSLATKYFPGLTLFMQKHWTCTKNIKIYTICKIYPFEKGQLFKKRELAPLTLDGYQISNAPTWNLWPDRIKCRNRWWDFKH